MRVAEKLDWKGLNTELNPIFHFLAVLGAHPILHVSKIRVKFSLSFFSFHLCYYSVYN
jgi:hypothetical protein